MSASWFCSPIFFGLKKGVWKGIGSLSYGWSVHFEMRRDHGDELGGFIYTYIYIYIYIYIYVCRERRDLIWDEEKVEELSKEVASSFSNPSSVTLIISAREVLCRLTRAYWLVGPTPIEKLHSNINK